MRWFPVDGKVPLVVRWQEAATNDEQTLAQWKATWPNSGLGTPTGEREGFFVLDVDKKSEGLETLANLEAKYGDLPDTYTVQTKNGGYHFYFEYPSGFKVKQTQGLFKGIDTRSDGGFVVAEGSDGYTGNGKDLLPAPQWLLELVRKPSSEIREGAATTPATPSSNAPKTPLNKRTLNFVALGAEDGRWHQEFVQAAFDMKANGYSQGEAEELLTKATGHLDSTDLNQLTDVYDKRVPMYPADTLTRSWTEYVDDYLDYVENPGRMEGTSTGLPELDKRLGGGVRPGEVVGVLAQAKVGKSSFTHKLIHSWLKVGKKVGYASRELRPSTEVLPNLFSIELRRNALRQIVKKEETASLNNWSLFFADGMGHMPLEDIEKWLRELVTLGVELVVFDHLHHFVEDEDYQTLAKFSRAIKALITELQLGCILVIQPRQLGMDERPSFRTIRGGAAIGQAIDALLVLEREKQQRDVVKVTLDIARHKLADPGETYIRYDKETMDFEEVVPEAVEEQSTGYESEDEGGARVSNGGKLGVVIKSLVNQQH